MLLEIDRGGELWWMTFAVSTVQRTFLRYGVKRPGVSYVVTFGYITKCSDSVYVPCTDSGEPLMYKARWGPENDAISYMETREQAMDIVLHMARNHDGYLRRPASGRNWCSHMRSFETDWYIWERVKC